MDNLKHKVYNQLQRKHRVRAHLTGTSDKPRLSVFISNRHVSAQIIDDSRSRTLAYATTVGQKITGNLTEKAEKIGTEIATKAKAVKIKHVVFDRNGKLYHGRVAALADAARKAGLEF